MPKLSTSRKSFIKSERRRIRNQAVRSRMRTFIKKARLAIEKGEKEEAENALKSACREIDIAKRKGVIHKNQADRRKSRLTILFNKKFETIKEIPEPEKEL
ncbi:MAG: 30S ribosomal protein S20 [bacterium]